MNDKYVYVCRGQANIKTPKVDDCSKIKVDVVQSSERIKFHEEFPNGLIFDMYQYPERTEINSNRKKIYDIDLSKKLED